ncbi:Ribonuclease H1 [Lactobacillus equicursoris DSM 19284 = JCM 14600 = CIP 110162]|uniref:RNase H type-1 domain-containing protein n=1 Tax=Lactobacillus equicursoris DSM 19284 = JCM 14600 = CIP 110162 TaxID=1293597 RepID=K0NWS0_9LACO|nr:RNase H family protein [Lactobacillus equicursoris]KRL01058.1 hypothetical protein FC20_GL001041 [Lactobacillus equicursoris DSM 19284 = JCM 14600 = CIP 110162]CCK85436.1 Ribonuclease H1 [Lactobacillus equicursoris DSM 19284 = JCM 14600 = CIP 110162]
MVQMSQINFKIPTDEKDKVVEIFNYYGLDLSTGIKMYLKEVAHTGTIPLKLTPMRTVADADLSPLAPAATNLEKADDPDYFAEVYTAGGGHNNEITDDSPAAWAYLIRINGEDAFDGSGGVPGASSNQMEITAFMEALKKLTELGYTDKKIRFLLNSQYVIQCVQGNWARRSNLDLWHEIDKYLAKFTEFNPAKDIKYTPNHQGLYGTDYVRRLYKDYMKQM